MHGMGVADAVIHEVKKIMGSGGGGEVKEIRVKVGRRMFPDVAELTEAFKLLVKDTPMESAELRIEFIDGRECVLDRVVFA